MSNLTSMGAFLELCGAAAVLYGIFGHHTDSAVGGFALIYWGESFYNAQNKFDYQELYKKSADDIGSHLKDISDKLGSMGSTLNK